MKIRNALLLLSLLALAVPLVVAGCQPEEPDPFDRSGNGSGDDDDDDATDEPGEDALDGWIEFVRDNVHGSTQASVEILASWFPAQEVERRPDFAADLDGCSERTLESTDFDVPDSTLDAGGTTLVLLDGTEVPLQLSGGLFRATLPSAAWVGEQEYVVRVGGGADIPPLELTGAESLGTPAALLVTSVELDPGVDLTIDWTGENNNGEVLLHLVGEDDDGETALVGCRLSDDGDATIPWDELEGLEGLEVYMEMVRSRSTDFDIPEERIGRVEGISQVRHLLDFPDLGDDDDDDAVDDDDSAGDDDDDSSN
jgi:hypothetical protein